MMEEVEDVGDVGDQSGFSDVPLSLSPGAVGYFPRATPALCLSCVREAETIGVEWTSVVDFILLNASLSLSRTGSTN